MLNLSTILTHYKRKDIQEEIILHSKNKEVVGSFKGESYAKRPDILKYPRDILELAKQGVTSFHASEELWKNPLQLDPMLKKSQLEDLRIGWDLVIDIDCPYIEYSKIAADLIIKALKHHNIEAISVKFSGNKGFHIGVPFEAFPSKIKITDIINTKIYFPDGVRLIALYLKDMVKEIFANKIFELENRDIKKVAQNLNKKTNEIVIGKKLNHDQMLDIDTILISSRHLYRVPYSLHEKSGLVSIPLDPDKILEFKKEMALPDRVAVSEKFRFLDKENVIPNQAKELFDKAIYNNLIKEKTKELRITEQKQFEIPETAIPEQFFPPCIKNILAGLEDGKKRSLFILTNFLISVGWGYDKIEKLLKAWNKKNPEPLRDVLLVGQLRYHKQQKKRILPPNCNNAMYYKDFGVCKPDNLCSKIKNPVNYSRRKTFYLHKEEKRGNESKDNISK